MFVDGLLMLLLYLSHLARTVVLVSERAVNVRYVDVVSVCEGTRFETAVYDTFLDEEDAKTCPGYTRLAAQHVIVTDDTSGFLFHRSVLSVWFPYGFC